MPFYAIAVVLHARIGLAQSDKVTGHKHGYSANSKQLHAHLLYNGMLGCMNQQKNHVMNNELQVGDMKTSRRKIVLGGLCLPAMGILGANAWGETTPIALQSTPALPDSVWVPPALVQMDYDMQGEWNGGPVSGSGSIYWTYQASKHNYTLELNISALFLSFLYASKGRYDEKRGFLPDAYREKRIGKDRTVLLNYLKNEVVFPWKPKDSTQALPEGTQDNTSVMLQIASLIARNPESIQIGQTFDFPMVRMGHLKHWTFVVVGQPEIKTRTGQYKTWHIKRVPPDKDNDTKTEFWLAPALRYFPVQMSFDASGSAQLKINLKKIRQFVA